MAFGRKIVGSLILNLDLMPTFFFYHLLNKRTQKLFNALPINAFIGYTNIPIRIHDNRLFPHFQALCYNVRSPPSRRPSTRQTRSSFNCHKRNLQIHPTYSYEGKIPFPSEHRINYSLSKKCTQRFNFREL